MILRTLLKRGHSGQERTVVFHELVPVVQDKQKDRRCPSL
jgi:hypothetical protein